MNIDILTHIHSCRHCRIDTTCHCAYVPVECDVCGKTINDKKPYVVVDHIHRTGNFERTICFECFNLDVASFVMDEMKAALSDFRRRVLGNSL